MRTRRALTVAIAAVAVAAVAAVAVSPAILGVRADAPAVVAVRAWSRTGPPKLATGVVVSRSRVMTVDHVLDGARRVDVEGSDGVRRTATVLRRDARLDIAILRVPG